jgi:hypothetical protein
MNIEESKLILSGNSTQECPDKVYIYDGKYLYLGYQNIDINNLKSKGNEHGRNKHRSD